MFRAAGRHLIRFRALWLIAVFAITGVAGTVALRDLGVDNSVGVFTPDGAVEMETLLEFREAFGRAEVFLVLVEGDVFSERFLERLVELHERIEALDVDVVATSHRAADVAAVDEVDPDFADLSEGDDEGWGDEAGGTVIEDVMSLVNARRTEPVGGDGIRVRKLLDPMPAPGDLAALKAEVLGDESLVGRVISRSGRHAVLAAQPMNMRDEDTEIVWIALRDRLADLHSDDFRIRITGTPAVNAAMNQMVVHDLTTLALYAAIVTLLVLGWLFRHPIGVVGPLVVVSLAVIWTLGFMGAAGFGLNLLSGVLPAFLFCVGVGDSVHFLTVYRDQRSGGVENEAAIVEALAITGPPVLFTSLTTMMGLLSLGVARVGAVAEMGWAGGFGVIAALLLSLVVLPIALTWNRTSLLGARERREDDTVGRWVRWLVARSDDRVRPGRRATVAGISLCLAALSVAGIAQLEMWHDDLSTVPEDAEVKQDVLAFDEHVAGVAGATLFIDPLSERGMKDVRLLQAMDRLVEHVLAYREPGTGDAIVTDATSLVDIVKETRQAFHRGDPAFHTVPETQGEADNLLFLFETRGPGELRRLATLDLGLSRLVFNVKWREATSYGALIDHIEAGVSEHLDGLATVRGTGHVYLGYRIVATLLHDLARSFAVAFLSITLLMVFMLRGLRLGLIAMLPNLFPIALVMGAMGWVGMPIDLNNLLIASIALGIAVDDTIHFLHHFRVGHARTGDVEEAIAEALHHAGRAMVSTSLILVAGFGVYLGATNVAVQRFGLLTGATVVAALLVDLVVLPALLRTCRAARTPSRSGAPRRRGSRPRSSEPRGRPRPPGSADPG